MFILAFVGIAAVIRRFLTLADVLPSQTDASRGAGVDTGFADHKILILIHILPGLLFMILGPLQFVPRIRLRYLQFHRWSGRVFMISALAVGLTAISLPAVKQPIGGLSEAAGSLFYGIFFVIALSKAWWHIRQKEISLHREWMIRAFAIGLAVATIRPMIAIFFVFSGLRPEEFFGTAFWIGFTLHLIVAELYINYTRTVSR